jgi:Domain of unknown function (DUF4129)
MTTPTRQATSRARSPRGDRFLFAEAAAPVWLACALLALEVIPVYTWLVVVAVYAGGGVDQAAIPLWLLALTALGYWWIGRRSARWWYGLETLFAIALCVGASLLAIVLAYFASSPSNVLDLSWLTGLENDLVAHGSSVSRAVLIVGIFAYLGWRAVSTGRRPPDVSGAKRRFTFSFAALVLASVSLVALPAGLRSLVGGLLVLLLPADVFAGLLASALARRQEAQAARAESAQIDSRRWMGAALILSGLVVLITLALGALINLDGISALLGHLGPVGQFLDNALNGTILLLERVFSTLFDGLVEWIRQAIRAGGRPTVQQPPQPVHPGKAPQNSALDRWRFVALAAMSVFVSLALILLAYGFLRLLRREEEAPPDDDIDEERSALDRGALREQIRDLLGRFQRGPRVAPDSLPSGSIRSLYRDVLAAATKRGLGRTISETPDEFASRLAGVVGDGAEQADVATLTAAYDTARYGEHEPQRAQADTLRAASQRLTRKIAGS